MVMQALGDQAVRPMEQVKLWQELAAGGGGLFQRMNAYGHGFPPADTPHQPDSVLEGLLGPHRRFSWAESTLAEFKKIRAALGGTVNDVVLTAIARAFQDLLRDRGEVLDGRVVRTGVPVSVRAPGEVDYGNRVAIVTVNLPVDVEGIVELHEQVRIQMDGVKESKQAVAADQLASLTGFAPPMLLAQGTRMAAQTTAQSPTRVLDTVVTNVPGPQRSLVALGRPMLDIIGMVPLNGMRIGTSIVSYNGRLTFGIVADFDTGNASEILARGVERALVEMTAAALERSGSAV
jgi:diacylglycerol O-acyltransferase